MNRKKTISFFTNRYIKASILKSFHGDNVVFPSKQKKKLTVSALAEA